MELNTFERMHISVHNSFAELEMTQGSLEEADIVQL
jgi:hypothetical protein